MKVTIRNPNAKFELVSCVSQKLYSSMRKCSLINNLRISGCRGETGEGVAVSRWHEASRQGCKVSVGSACYTSVFIVRTGRERNVGYFSIRFITKRADLMQLKQTYNPTAKWIIWIYAYFHIFSCILHHERVYYELTMWPAPRWLDSSVGRALHRYRKGHGLESRLGLNFFQALISQLRWSTMSSCNPILLT